MKVIYGVLKPGSVRNLVLPHVMLLLSYTCMHKECIYASQWDDSIYGQMNAWIEYINIYEPIGHTKQHRFGMRDDNIPVISFKVSLYCK